MLTSPSFLKKFWVPLFLSRAPVCPFTRANRVSSSTKILPWLWTPSHNLLLPSGGSRFPAKILLRSSIPTGSRC
jgi:hypothetical protein